MSDSDDTDVLLLVPPDVFVVPSSDSDDSSDSNKRNKSSAVSELIDHVQTLETRISAIESKESLNNSIDYSQQLTRDSIMNCRQTLPRTRFSVSQNPSLQNTPTKHPPCLSLPPTPSNRQSLLHTNKTHRVTNSHEKDPNNAMNFNTWSKHNDPKLFSEPVLPQTSSQNKNTLHAGVGSPGKDSLKLSSATNVTNNKAYSKSHSSLSALNSSSTLTDRFQSGLKPIKDMSLSEVEDFLHEIETNDERLTTKNGSSSEQHRQMNSKRSPDSKSCLREKDDRDRRKTMDQNLKWNFNGYNSSRGLSRQSDYDKRKDVTDHTTHNDSSFSSMDTNGFMDELKTWTPNFQHDLSSSKIDLAEHFHFDDNEKTSVNQHKDSDQKSKVVDNGSYVPTPSIPRDSEFCSENSKRENMQKLFDPSLMSKYADEFTRSQTIPSTPGIVQDNPLASCKSCPSIFKTPSNASISNHVDTSSKRSESSKTLSANSFEQNANNTVNSTVNNTVARNQRPQRLLTLSDFWNHDSSKSLEEQLRIKLEEERFRREHCEQMIQDLQKKLLEQQEKVAVAIRVDNEKNALLVKLQMSWKKMKQRLCELESERDSLQQVLKGISGKHQAEVVNYCDQIKSYKEELSKALDLATGYKEKSDCLYMEKLDLLKSHADELQSYKSLVQQAENKYEEMKVECQKLLEKNQQTDETLRAVQQDLNKELLKGGEVRAEMAVIHKALDSCEAELTILRQEKDNLHLKLKEENNRNNILQDGKATLIAAVDEAKQAEKTAKNEVKILTEQQDKLRAELREVYQKQVDEVVKAKLQEFQTQLDSAEMVFQNELEMKQRAIAEIAARKMKSVIDKHQVEINLVEEKHKEEKKLLNLKLAQTMQRSSMLEAQLNCYRKSKNQLVEQLHSMMQKQWQQALMIISGGNGDAMSSLQKMSVDKLFDLPNESNHELIPNHCSTLQAEPMKLDSQKYSQNGQEHQNESLITLTSSTETPLTSRKDSKNDLKKYLKMIFDMQQSKEDTNQNPSKFFSDSPPFVQRENPNHQRDNNTSNDGNSTWQPVSEISAHDTSEYLSVPQRLNLRSDQLKYKPPWK